MKSYIDVNGTSRILHTHFTNQKLNIHTNTYFIYSASSTIKAAFFYLITCSAYCLLRHGSLHAGRRSILRGLLTVGRASADLPKRSVTRLRGLYDRKCLVVWAPLVFITSAFIFPSRPPPTPQVVGFIRILCERRV